MYKKNQIDSNWIGRRKESLGSILYIIIVMGMQVVRDARCEGCLVCCVGDGIIVTGDVGDVRKYMQKHIYSLRVNTHCDWLIQSLLPATK